MKLVFAVAALLSVCLAVPTTPGSFVLDLSGGVANTGGGAAPQPGADPGPPGNTALDPVIAADPAVSFETNVGHLEIALPPPAGGLNPYPGRNAPETVHIGSLTGGSAFPALLVPAPAPAPVAGGAFPLITDHGGLTGAGAAPAVAAATNVMDWTCEGYRAHPTNLNMYQVFFNMQWADYSCFGILTWNQTLCSCVIPPDTGDVDPNCPNNRAVATDPTLYEIKHWGVWLTLPKRCPMDTLWNQTGCRCDWDPMGPGAVVDAPVGGICDLMFNATFTYELIDDANYNSIGRDPWFNVKVENGSARLDNGRMPVWAFASNDFARAFQIQFNFKLDANVATAKQYTTLVSNGCSYDRPSIGISYRPIDQSYSVYFRDVFVENTLDCTSPTLTPYEFQSVSLEYQHSQLYLKVNGQVCLQSNIFGGDIAISRCPFYLGGDGLLQYMSGNIDEVVVRRFCVSPV